MDIFLQKDLRNKAYGPNAATRLQTYPIAPTNVIRMDVHHIIVRGNYRTVHTVDSSKLSPNPFVS